MTCLHHTIFHGIKSYYYVMVKVQIIKKYTNPQTTIPRKSCKVLLFSYFTSYLKICRYFFFVKAINSYMFFYSP
jgi:hypothetical protein